MTPFEFDYERRIAEGDHRATLALGRIAAGIAGRDELRRMVLSALEFDGHAPVAGPTLRVALSVIQEQLETYLARRY